MKALVYHGARDIAYEAMDDPELHDRPRCDRQGRQVRHLRHRTCTSITAKASPRISAICVGHEAVGEVVEVGRGVHQLKVGDKVMISAAVGCGAVPLLPCGRGQPVRQQCRRLLRSFGQAARLPGRMRPCARRRLQRAENPGRHHRRSGPDDDRRARHRLVRRAQCRHPARLHGRGRRPRPHRPPRCRSRLRHGRARASSASTSWRTAAPRAAPSASKHPIPPMRVRSSRTPPAAACATASSKPLATPPPSAPRSACPASAALSRWSASRRTAAFEFPMSKAFGMGLTFRIGTCSVPQEWPELIPLVQSGRFKPERYITPQSSAVGRCACLRPLRPPGRRRHEDGV